MIVGNTVRLRAALDQLARFQRAGVAKPSGSPPKPPSNAQRAALRRSPVGWPVEREVLASQIEDRLRGRNLPAQVATSYCGCAAFLYCLLEDRPDLYMAYATSLWSGGRFSFRSPSASLKVDVDEETKRSHAAIKASKPRGVSISDLDWMTMASLSGATRYFPGGAPTPTAPDDRARAITFPWMIRRWFKAAGSKARIDSAGLGLGGGSADDFLSLIAAWRGHWLVIQVDASLLTGGNTSIQQRHWIVVDPHAPPQFRIGGRGGKVMTVSGLRAELAAHPFGRGPHPLEAVSAAARAAAVIDAVETNVKFVTWGKEHQAPRGPTLGNIVDRFYGGFAFPRFR